MGVDGSDSRVQTLGDLILGLEAGKPCPWCGCTLERSGSLEAVDRSKGETSVAPMDEPLLRCPSCGTEICEHEASTPAGHRGSLGVAA